MRALLSVIFFSLFVVHTSAQHDLFKEANTLYDEKKYEEAASLYEEILSQGYVADDLLYNLANAYYRKGILGKAILNYEKTLLLNPKHADAKSNLEFALSKTKDKIEPVPANLVDWIYENIGFGTPNFWPVISFIMSFLTAICVILFKVLKNHRLKKVSFYASIVLFVTFLITFSASWLVHRNLTKMNHGVILTSKVEVKTAPAENAETLYTIHEGAKFSLISLNDEWAEISINQGNIGWIKKEEVGFITLKKD